MVAVDAIAVSSDLCDVAREQLDEGTSTTAASPSTVQVASDEDAWQAREPLNDGGDKELAGLAGAELQQCDAALSIPSADESIAWRSN